MGARRRFLRFLATGLGAEHGGELDDHLLQAALAVDGPDLAGGMLLFDRACLFQQLLPAARQLGSARLGGALLEQRPGQATAEEREEEEHGDPAPGPRAGNAFEPDGDAPERRILRAALD